MKQQAAEGDAVAACRIAFELNRCSNLDMMRSITQSTGGPALSPTLKMLRRQVEEGETACAGLADEELDWTFDYALSAALAGNRESRYQVARSYAVGLDWFSPERTLEAWARWRQHVPALVEAGIADGDPRVFAHATWDYLNPDHGFRVFPRDPTRALALRFALADASTSAGRETHEREAHYLIIHESLTETEIARARAIAMTFKVRPRADGAAPRSPYGEAADCEAR